MNLEQLKTLSKKLGVEPSKSLGQNFLINEKVLEKIVEVSGVGEKDVVFEIGPGLGVLTEKLITRVKKVVAVEFDKRVIDYLISQFPSAKILQEDILNLKNEKISELCEGEYKIVSNIPYNITSPIIQKFTEQTPKPVSMTLMIQKEVAQRVCAQPGDLSILGVAVQFYGKCEYHFEVSKNDFWPAPKVDSAVITITPHDRYLKKLNVEVKDFFRIVKFGFAARRKKLVNTLAAGLHKEPKEIQPILAKLKLGENARAQELSVERWVELANEIYTAQETINNKQ